MPCRRILEATALKVFDSNLPPPSEERQLSPPTHVKKYEAAQGESWAASLERLRPAVMARMS